MAAPPPTGAAVGAGVPLRFSARPRADGAKPGGQANQSKRKRAPAPGAKAAGNKRQAVAKPAVVPTKSVTRPGAAALDGLEAASKQLIDQISAKSTVRNFEGS